MLLVWQIPRAAGNALAQRAIAAAELPRVDDAVIYPASSMRAAMGAVTRLFADLRATGHVKASLPDMQTRKELYETLEYTPGEEWVMPAHFNK